jgi:tRNA threonylcarbamoyladenosine biosynthesis protein TsaB
MLMLALDTATAAGSVALLDEQRVRVSRYFDVGLQHSHLLFAELEQVLSLGACRAADLDGVAVTIGPGSFTGLRIGLSAAKGLCLAGASSLVAVPTLEALASQVLYAAHPVCALIGASRGEVYAAVYDTRSGRPCTQRPARAMTPETLVGERAGAETIFVGDGVERCRPVLDACPWALLAPFPCGRPEAAWVGWLGLERLRRGQTADLAAVEPDYLRTPEYRPAAGR